MKTDQCDFSEPKLVNLASLRSWIRLGTWASGDAWVNVRAISLTAWRLPPGHARNWLGSKRQYQVGPRSWLGSARLGDVPRCRVGPAGARSQILASLFASHRGSTRRRAEV